MQAFPWKGLRFCAISTDGEGMAYTAIPRPPINEDAVKERLDRTLAGLKTNDAIAEFYCEMRAQIALRRARLEEEMTFERSFMAAAENLFKARFGEAKRIPAEGYDITLEGKSEKQYDAEPLLTELGKVITSKELEKAIFPETKLKTNGTEINKLVRAYGAGSDVAKLVEQHTTVVQVGAPKLKIEKRV